MDGPRCIKDGEGYSIFGHEVEGEFGERGERGERGEIDKRKKNKAAKVG